MFKHLARIIFKLKRRTIEKKGFFICNYFNKKNCKLGIDYIESSVDDNQMSLFLGSIRLQGKTCLHFIFKIQILTGTFLYSRLDILCKSQSFYFTYRVLNLYIHTLISISVTRFSENTYNTKKKKTVGIILTILLILKLGKFYNNQP